MDSLRRPVPGGPLVLIACADEGRLGELTELVAAWHYAVETAKDGAGVLVRLKEAAPGLIALLDMDLPPAGGADIVRKLSAGGDGRRSWLMLAGSRSESNIRTAIEAGCDDFLALPPEPLEWKLRLRVAEREWRLARRLPKPGEEVRFDDHHDPLTGLWNRQALLRLIFQETDRVQRTKADLCLMVMDLDDFARINRDYGYEAGDKLLGGLADRFRRYLRSYDLIGRCGDDEFLLALPGCDAENGTALAERIRSSLLSRPFAVGSEATTLTASFGIALSRGRSPLVVLRDAERALAEAKQAGKNRVRCDVRASMLASEPLFGSGTISGVKER
ncbi:MAG: diguanylate cyclase response regulator [Acidobacteriaceae bacterium]